MTLIAIHRSIRSFSFHGQLLQSFIIHRIRSFLFTGKIRSSRKASFVTSKDSFTQKASFVTSQDSFSRKASFVTSQVSLITNQVSFITSFVFGGQAGRVIISIYNSGFWPQSHRGLFGTILKASLRYFGWRMDFVVSSGTPLPRSPPFPFPPSSSDSKFQFHGQSFMRVR